MPIIEYIDPEIVPIGSSDTLVVIYGLNFGTSDGTKVRLTERGISQELTPISVSPNQISVIIPANLLDAPTQYLLQVVIYINGTIPADGVSNPVPFTIYSPDTYLPIITKNATH